MDEGATVYRGMNSFEHYMLHDKAWDQRVKDSKEDLLDGFHNKDLRQCLYHSAIQCITFWNVNHHHVCPF
jgi:hypothetical protein